MELCLLGPSLLCLFRLHLLGLCRRLLGLLRRLLYLLRLSLLCLFRLCRLCLFRLLLGRRLRGSVQGKSAFLAEGLSFIYRGAAFDTILHNISPYPFNIRTQTEHLASRRA